MGLPFFAFERKEQIPRLRTAKPVMTIRTELALEIN
jgi:hypothetical protein